MHSTADKVARVKALYATWANTRGHCPEAIADIFADRVHLASMDESQPGLAFAPVEHTPALALAASRSTRDEAVNYFTGILADWEMVHHSPDHVFADGDKVAMFGRCGWRHKVTGKVADCRISNFWRFENGQVVEFIDVFDSARAVAAAT